MHRSATRASGPVVPAGRNVGRGIGAKNAKAIWWGAQSETQAAELSGRGRQQDPSSVLDSLMAQYATTGRPIKVSFRKLVGPISVAEHTHSAFPYPARLLRQIPRFFLSCEQFGKPALTLDPFCGSGTVLVECAAAGRPSWGVDSNPLARLIARLKTEPVDLGAAILLGDQVLADAKQSRRRSPPPIVNPTHWHSRSALSALTRIASAIENMRPDGSVGRFLRVALALTAEHCSFRDPRIPVPVRRNDWASLVDVHTTSMVWRTFHRAVAKLSQRLKHSVGWAPVHVLGHDSRDLDRIFAAHRRDLKARPSLVITSPPYGAAQKYIRSSSLSLGWTGEVQCQDIADRSMPGHG
jgi:hypothetical protein